MANMHLVTGYAGQEHVTAADQGAFNTALFGSGQFVLGKGNKLSASVVTNNLVRVLDGDLYMQGRHIRLDEGTYVDLTIENGAQGVLRNDLIVARYTKGSADGIENVNLVVIKGTAVASNPADPAYTSGDIINDHVELNDMPLYRVPIDGINVQDLVPLFTVFDTTIPSVFEKVKNEHYTKTEVDKKFKDTDTELEQVKTSVSEGKALIAAAVTDKGVATAADATFQTMASNIASIVTSPIPYEVITGVSVYAKNEDTGNSNKQFSWSESNLGRSWFAEGVTFQTGDLFVITSHPMHSDYSFASGSSTNYLYMRPFGQLPNQAGTTPKLLAGERVYGFVIRGIR